MSVDILCTSRSLRLRQSLQIEEKNQLGLVQYILLVRKETTTWSKSSYYGFINQRNCYQT